MDKFLLGYLQSLVKKRPRSKKGLVHTRLTSLELLPDIYGVDYFKTVEREDSFDCLSILNYKIILIKKPNFEK